MQRTTFEYGSPYLTIHQFIFIFFENEMMHLKVFIPKIKMCCNCSLFSNHNTDRVGKRYKRRVMEM